MHFPHVSVIAGLGRAWRERALLRLDWEEGREWVLDKYKKKTIMDSEFVLTSLAFFGAYGWAMLVIYDSVC